MENIALIGKIILAVLELIKKAFAGDEPSKEGLLKLLGTKQLKSELVKQIALERAKAKFSQPR